MQMICPKAVLIINQLTCFWNVATYSDKWGEESHIESCRCGLTEQIHVRFICSVWEHFMVQTLEASPGQTEMPLVYLDSALTFKDNKWFI